MLRKVFVILLTLPMLLPPGFCLCRLDGIAVRKDTGGKQPTAAAQETAADARCGCRNPNCQHRRPDARPAQNAVENTKGKVPAPSPLQDHSPGCPAHPSYAISRAVAPDSLTRLADLPLGGMTIAWLPLDGHAPQGSPPAAFAVLPPAPPAPLFLLCCDFRC